MNLSKPQSMPAMPRVWIYLATLLFILISSAIHAADGEISRLVRLTQEKVESLGFDASLSRPEDGLLVVQFGSEEAKIYWACGFFQDSGTHRYETLLTGALASPEAQPYVPSNKDFKKLEKSIREAARAGNIPLKRAHEVSYGLRLIQRMEKILESQEQAIPR